MRIPVVLAWTLLLLTFFTAGLLRRFHEQTPMSPYLLPAFGSLIFAAWFLILLVAAREWQQGAVRGRGVRLGSLTPLLLMLLTEKWISLAVYDPAYAWLAPVAPTPAIDDARFRAFAGLGLLLVCALVAGFSVPTARKTWRRVRPSRWPKAALGTFAVVTGAYVLLGGAAWALGGSLRLEWPRADRLLVWVLVGQALLALAEEVYYRGLLLSETERLAPRLGMRSAVARRWTALLATSALFGLEHLQLDAPTEQILRQSVFTVSLGLLLGVLVMLSANLHFVAGLHAWINWLLLGAAPRFVDSAGQPALPAGTYIGVGLVLAFTLAYLRRGRLRPLHSRPGATTT